MKFLKTALKTALVLIAMLTLHPVNAQQYTIVVHGGAGNGLYPEAVSPQRQSIIKAAVNEALAAGAQVLENGGEATDAVVAVLSILENDTNFNAGRGAVLTYQGAPSLDASIMDGQTLEAGAVSGVQRIKNPIAGALAVLQNSPHVLLSGSGADEFGAAQQLKLVAPEYFITPNRLKGLKKFKANYGALENWPANDTKFGTVGCAVLDAKGNLAAGTSTGGMMGKRHGRIGDSPIIGAGTYANNATCAVSCTGHGEYFMRYAVAYDVHARMAYKSQSGGQAAKTIIHSVLKEVNGAGGLIGITASGEIIMEFNTKGMIRGYLKQGEPAFVALFND
jgi:beta-aspartyl-peptidase (threonine type)